MNKKDADHMLREIIAAKQSRAMAALRQMPNLKRAWSELVHAGFKDGAEAMRSAIIFYLMTEPEATESEVVRMLADKVNYNINQLNPDIMNDYASANIESCADNILSYLTFASMDARNTFAYDIEDHVNAIKAIAQQINQY